MPFSPVAHLVDTPPHHAPSQNHSQRTRISIHPLAPIQAIWNSVRQNLPQTIDTAHPQTPSPLQAATALQQDQTQWNNLFQRRRTHVTLVPDGNRPIVLTTDNQRANEPWGDTLQEKPDDHIQIYAMNVNGFSLDRRGGQFDTSM